MIQAFLVWCSVASVLLACIIAPGVLNDGRIPRWRRAAYVVVLGPPVWAVLFVALLVSLFAFLADWDKRRRAKTAKG